MVSRLVSLHGSTLDVADNQADERAFERRALQLGTQARGNSCELKNCTGARDFGGEFEEKIAKKNQPRSCGRRTRNSVLPGSDEKVIVPPYCSTIRCTMPRPSPVPTPTGLVV